LNLPAKTKILKRASVFNKATKTEAFMFERAIWDVRVKIYL